jgi:hypothetical protein
MKMMQKQMCSVIVLAAFVAVAMGECPNGKRWHAWFFNFMLVLGILNLLSDMMLFCYSLQCSWPVRCLRHVHLLPQLDGK